MNLLVLAYAQYFGNYLVIFQRKILGRFINFYLSFKFFQKFLDDIFRDNVAYR